ncbi:MAG TPA: PIG-L deacetylase family protein [Tepidisphaeraceae bacterium]|nr:PIG-L deacetylase family protein [Tepidisphaeraceae bacterium]
MLTFLPNLARPLHVLCLGAHSDDIEIGCGGTLLRLIREKRVARVDWVVFSSTPARAAEARRGADHFLAGAPERSVDVLAHRDGFFPYEGAAVKATFEFLKAKGSPDLVFTHHRDDLHQDHRLMAEMTWNTFRNHAIFEYEITKYDGNPFSPNAYVTLDEADCRGKVAGLMTAFETQASKGWFTEDTFMATLRLRGVECASPTKFAEAFVCRKVVL